MRTQRIPSFPGLLRAVAARAATVQPAEGAARALDASDRQVGQRARWRQSFGSAFQPAAGVLQGKFTGKYGSVLAALTPDHLGVPDNFYAGLWRDLNQSPKDIAVEAGAPSYEQSTRTLYLSETVLMSLLQKQAPDDKVKASWVAHITHELSHAHDHVLKGREIRTPVLGGRSNHTKDVIETELRAWAREALSAHQLSPKNLDTEKASLVAGWKAYATGLLDDVGAAAAGNEIIARLARYVERELARKVNTDDPDIPVQDWVNQERNWLDGELTRHQKSLAPYW